MKDRKPFKFSGRVPLFFGTTNETELITNKRLPRKLKKRILKSIGILGKKYKGKYGKFVLKTLKTIAFNTLG